MTLLCGFALRAGQFRRRSRPGPCESSGSTPTTGEVRRSPATRVTKCGGELEPTAPDGDSPAVRAQPTVSAALPGLSRQGRGTGLLVRPLPGFSTRRPGTAAALHGATPR